MFSSLYIKNFRLYFIALLILFTGTWVQTTVQGWLVLEVSGSSFYLGLVGFFATFPSLIFTLPAGVVVDRYNKKHLVILCQAIFAVLTFTFAVLISTKLINLTLILLIATMIGIISSLDYTARQSYVVEIVGKEHLLNAVALNSVAFNISRVIGPMIATLLTKITSTLSSCFYANGVSFLIGMILFSRIFSKGNSFTEKKEGVFGELMEGFSYVVKNKIILFLLIIISLQGFFVMPYLTLLPAFVKEILKSDIAALGILMSAGGVGAILGSLLVARMDTYKDTMIIYLYIVASVFIILFSFSNKVEISSLITIVISGCITSGMALVNTKIQVKIPDNLRGRIMSMYILSFTGSIPFGNLFAGYLSRYLGITHTFVVLGICLTLFLLASLKPYVIFSQLDREK